MSTATISQMNRSLDGQSVNYLRNWLLDTIATDPGVAEALQLKLNTTDNRLKYHDGTELKTVALLSDLDAYTRYRGSHDATIGVPTPASSPLLPNDPIKAGDKWLVVTPGTIAGIGGESDNLGVGDFIVAAFDDASTPEDFVAINANIDTTDMAIAETAALATLPADTATNVTASNLASIEVASIRDSAGLDLTSSLVLTYSGNSITLQSSVALTNLDIRMVGKAS